MQTKGGSFMFEEMLAVTEGMAAKIDNSMCGIVEHLQSHRKWAALTAIENESVTARLDDERVELLHDKGLREVAEVEAKHESSPARYKACSDSIPRRARVSNDRIVSLESVKKLVINARK